LRWLTGRTFKTIADFRKGNAQAIRNICRELVVLCRRLQLLSEASVAIDDSKFKAANTRDRNFTQAKMQRRLAQIDESIPHLNAYYCRFHYPGCVARARRRTSGVDVRRDAVLPGRSYLTKINHGSGASRPEPGAQLGATCARHPCELAR
jgi:hypothetical protein